MRENPVLVESISTTDLGCAWRLEGADRVIIVRCAERNYHDTVMIMQRSTHIAIGNPYMVDLYDYIMVESALLRAGRKSVVC